jgi:alkylation response protein AidB-like acyl-CoA dehydrogenase
MGDQKNIKGCAFLEFGCTDNGLMTPERFPADVRSVREYALAFARGAIDPAADALESNESDRYRPLLRRLGELGYLGIGIPEEFGGIGADILAVTAVLEGLSRCESMSFVATYSVHTGIGTAPLLYFGTDAQRERYLPRLADGSCIASYALTEPGSGSDALAARTVAVQQPDGSWILNGEKAFITNAGLSDVFTVFAKVDGKPTCFIVERGTPGFTIGAEEHKLGLRGSSTCALGFVDAHLPPGALLGEVGQGHKIVLNTLNLGRFKVGVACLGQMKRSLDAAVAYAAERRQFGRSLDSFGAIRRMLAATAVDTWVGESMVYRLVGMLQQALSPEPRGDTAAAAIHEVAVECALVKTALAGMLSAAADREVQILGGNGLMEDYPAERCLRDARIMRIIEGTDEINKIAAVTEVVKRIKRGKIVLEGDAFPATELRTDAEAHIGSLVSRMREDLQGALTAAMTAFGAGLPEQQEIVLDLADMMGRLFAAESAFLRLRSLAADHPVRTFAEAATLLFLQQERAAAMAEFERVIVAAVAASPVTITRRSALLAPTDALGDTIGLQRLVADMVVTAHGYPC